MPNGLANASLETIDNSMALPPQDKSRYFLEKLKMVSSICGVICLTAGVVVGYQFVLLTEYAVLL